jgi:hypothetical protein
MRIPKSWVPLLTHKILDNLISKELVKPAVPIETLFQEAEEIILEELTVEDRLNSEVRGILQSYSSEIEKGHLDYRRLFELTKRKLIKERNLIL